MLANALQAAGIVVHLLAAGSLLRRLEPLLHVQIARRVGDIEWSSESGMAGAGRQAEGLAAVLAGFRPDVLVLPLPWPDHGLGLMQAAAAAGIPTLVVCHLAPPDPPSGLAEVRKLGLAGMRAAWIAVSGPVARRAEQFFGLMPRQVQVVNNGVPVPPDEDARAAGSRRARLRTALGLGDETPVALFAGRLAIAKGADLLPGVARDFHAAAGGVVVCAGEGPLRERIEREAGPGLRLLGYRTDVADLLLAADMLLLPSRLEGCPLISLEAAVRRRPVVATWAALEYLGAAASEQAVMAADNSKALAEGLRQALQPSVAGRIVAEAWRQAALHDRDAMLRRYLDAVRGLMAL